MAVSERTYQMVALEDPEGQWELYCGRLRQKPGMSYEHGFIIGRLSFRLQGQLDEAQFMVSCNHTRLRISPERTYIPDICVVPMELIAPHRGSRELDVFEAPLPLVAEIWLPSTGDFDVEVKLRDYQRRGDQEIWRIHPYDRTLTTWVRQPNGSYAETTYTEGVVHPVALPGVAIDLAALFA
jgi:Uma2 family endonuclease